MSQPESGKFEDYRSYLFAIAYRMLGSATEAEDIVQEAYLRYQAQDLTQIVSHKAFLSTVVTRLCLNQLKSARVQREQYTGPWLPEPVLTDADPAFAMQQTDLADSLSIAFLMLLEQLTPMERAVFLLREVFSFDYAEIGEIVGSTETACRQMLARAKKHLADHQPRYRPSHDAQRKLLDRFLQATRDGNLDGLKQLLTDDITMWADGGGKARGAALQPIHGPDAVARFLLNSVHLAPGEIHIDIAEVNNEPGVVIRAADKTIVVLAVSTDGTQIDAIRAMANPDKLLWIESAMQSKHSDKDEENK